MSPHVASCRLMSPHVASCRLMSPHVASCRRPPISHIHDLCLAGTACSDCTHMFTRSTYEIQFTASLLLSIVLNDINNRTTVPIKSVLLTIGILAIYKAKDQWSVERYLGRDLARITGI